MGGASFTDPNTMALLGAMQGLGQASAPSRLPVTNGMVFGQLAGGLMGGGQQALQNQLLGQEVLSKGTQTAQSFPMLQLLYSGLGLKPPSIQDIKQGKLQGLESLLQGMQTPTTPTAPASASPAMASTAAPSAPATQLAMANPGTAAGVERTDADRAPSTDPAAWPFPNLPVSGTSVAGAPTTGQVASVIGPAPETASGSLPGAPFPTRAAPSAPSATTLAQAAPGAGAPVVAGGIMANPIANAMFRRMITGTLTPVDQAMLSAQISPQGSVQQLLNNALAAKAGGYAPFVGGERPGVPGRVLSFDAQGRPQWSIAFQNPRLPEGALMGNGGEVAMAPGALPAIGAEATAKASGPATYKEVEVFDQNNVPHKTTAAMLPALLASGQFHLPTGAPPPGAAPAAGVAPGPAGVLPGTSPPPSGGLPSRSPESAVPTYPVRLPNGTAKDISQLTINDMFPGGQGITQPPPSPLGTIPGPPTEGQKTLQKKDAELVSEFQDQATSNPRVYDAISHIRDALGRGLNTNNLAPIWADLRNTAQGLGIDFGLPAGANPNDAAIFEKSATQLMMSVVQQFKGQPRVVEFVGSAKSNPNLTMPIAANYKIATDILSYGKWQDARANLARQFITEHPNAPLQDFTTQFNRLAPFTDMRQYYENWFTRLGIPIRGATEGSTVMHNPVTGEVRDLINGQWVTRGGTAPIAPPIR